MRDIALLLAFVCFLYSNSALSQTTIPEISNVTALIDTISKVFTINYDVNDAEGDSMEVYLGVSTDGGNIYSFNTNNATGDVGYPIFSGTSKQIHWYYPDSINFQLSNLQVKLTADDRFSFDIQSIIDQIDTNRLKQNLQFIEGVRHHTSGQTHLLAIQDSLVNIFEQYEMQSRVNEFPYNSSYIGKNIIGRMPGEGDERKTYVVSGHYDTVSDSPGADDNGCAIAGIMEMARVITPLQFANTIEFIAFDLEEAGLLGSEAYVPNGIESYEDVEGVLNMDMIGYYSDEPNSQTVPAGFDFVFPDLYAQIVANEFRGNFILSTSNDGSVGLMDLFDTLADQYVPDLLVGSIHVPGNGEAIPDARRSDHAAFWDAAIPALHISDGAETRNPNYHSPTDVSSTINYKFMSDVVKATLATILTLARPINAGTATAQVSIDPETGILLLNEKTSKLSLYPNPSNGKFRFKLFNCIAESAQIRIINMEGKEVWRLSESDTKQILSTNDSEINFGSSLKKGNYIFEMCYSNGKVSKRILVE